jgi:tetratricopeptide (TPR) repeat protein
VDGAAAVDEQSGIVERLAALLDTSLIRRVEGHSGRLAMFETVAEYAREQLQRMGEEPSARARHAGWYCVLGRRAEHGLRCAERLAWMERLEAELHNLRVALGWAIHERNDPVAGLELASRLWQFWHVRGRHAEGRAWIAAARAQVGVSASALRGRAELADGYLTWFQREYRSASRALEQAVLLLRDADDPPALIEALAMAAVCAASLAAHDADPAALAAEAAELAIVHGELWEIGMARFWQGVIAAERGEMAAASGFAQASITAFETAGDAWNGGPHSTLGDLARARGDHASAREHYQAALGCFRAIGDKWGCAFSLRVLAELALHRDSHDEALVR